MSFTSGMGLPLDERQRARHREAGRLGLTGDAWLDFVGLGYVLEATKRRMALSDPLCENYDWAELAEAEQQAGAEIEVTLAMIEAGAFELAKYDDAHASLEEGALAIYRAMVHAGRGGS